MPLFLYILAVAASASAAYTGLPVFSVLFALCALYVMFREEVERGLLRVADLLTMQFPRTDP